MYLISQWYLQDLYNRVVLLQNRMTVIEEQLKYTIQLGDLKENSEFDILNNELSCINNSIREIDLIISQGKVHTCNDIVIMGSILDLCHEHTNMRIHLVSPFDADILQSKYDVSNSVIRGIIGKKKDDSIIINNKNWLILNIVNS